MKEKKNGSERVIDLWREEEKWKKKKEGSEREKKEEVEGMIGKRRRRMWDSLWDKWKGRIKAEERVCQVNVIKRKKIMKSIKKISNYSFVEENWNEWRDRLKD